MTEEEKKQFEAMTVVAYLLDAVKYHLSGDVGTAQRSLDIAIRSFEEYFLTEAKKP